ncbi:isoprenylcysteine carboxylmethyltransferase family protein [Ideonella azotifigens]|uniref:Isoprenylcysteine carboxylmethyltransferase family protein n=1 Tax=Ideonella azotifigens TaxID=513160 RepID=A0ABN1JX87_9BURK|nr:isoprenylcysteine carboxylmethyltransferase family protein [Ideonella azotifigens]MCD2341267.1 isoprenylcysteine carboxylmethyltransferase family protein [Ideonella azotifigens]
MPVDPLLYLTHGLFWTSFGLTRWWVSRHAAVATEEAPATTGTSQAVRGAGLLIAFHSVAFGLMYFEIGARVLGGRVPSLFPGQRLAGTAVIALGAWLACWALRYFASWRFQAKLDTGHRLATGGPFRWLRHPIYMALNLLALGSLLWVPSPLMLAALVLMCLGSDLRARAEERLLTQAFGSTYRHYCDRTPRFVPGVY